MKRQEDQAGTEEPRNPWRTGQCPKGTKEDAGKPLSNNGSFGKKRHNRRKTEETMTKRTNRIGKGDQHPEIPAGSHRRGRKDNNTKRTGRELESPKHIEERKGSEAANKATYEARIIQKQEDETSEARPTNTKRK